MHLLHEGVPQLTREASWSEPDIEKPGSKVADVGDLIFVDVNQIALAHATALVHLDHVRLEPAAGLKAAATALGNFRSVVINMADGLKYSF